MKRLLITAASVLALTASPAFAQDMVVTNAKLVIGDGGAPIEGGVVIVDDGKVVFAGVPTPGQTFSTDVLIDAGGAWVTPGLFATVTTLGLADVSAVDESNDITARETPFSAALDAATAINPTSQHILVHKAAGITRAATSMMPSGSIFAGQGAIIDLDGDAKPVMQARAFQMINLGEGGADRAGGSRAAAHALLRSALREAQALVGKSGIPETTEIGKDDEVFLSRFDAEALVPVVTGKQKLYVAVERMADIRAVLALKAEYPKLDLVLVGVTEGWLVANEIAAAGVPVIANGLNDLPETFEQLGATQSNAGRMAKAGVTVAINAESLQNPRRLQQVAGNLVALTRIPGASGMDWGKAFAAISSVPAEISGMGGKAGVLKPGALGDVVMWSGDPLEVGSVPTKVFIAGVEQDLSNHQTRLRDRYIDLDESDRPKAYDW
ncbi:imidazolonepropionase-like amidohydrolase [Erythromicrobium ramosum]|uniref:Amidohydrolase family protein n=1 Tax=Erythrobacter ramosus TaxID=35811 RepID=A0A6I4UGW0_9SPHN|nr:imidazolonepropionase-like amidohydrolase [Erythrobacter ramosus]MXP37756.1 amidohydrolase family protein [Erythrobacter ramosus]